MSVAFYIVLDHQNPGFDTFVNGKAIAHCDALETILERQGFKNIYDYMDGDEDFDEEDDFEFEPSKYQWFTPSEGIEYFGRIKAYLQNNPAEVEEAEDIISDLDEYLEVLHKAAAIGAKWHLRLDF